MKAATFGLVLGALSVANASLFEDEDSFLQEEWEDFDDRELQDIDSLLVEPEGGSTAAVFEEPDIDVDALAEEGEEEGERQGVDDRAIRRKRRNKMRRDRRRKNKKNRKGKKGRKGRKGKKDKKKKKKGPFNIEDHNEKLAKREAKMIKKLAKKCRRRTKHTQEFCEQSQMDQESCQGWSAAMDIKCKENAKCTKEHKSNVGKCTGAFKLMMASFRNPEVDPSEFNNAAVGQCYTNSLIAAEKCIKSSQEKVSKALEGITEPTEDELNKFKEEAKKAAKAKKREARKNRKKNRWNKRRNKRKGRKGKNRRNKRKNRRNKRGEDGEEDGEEGGEEGGSGGIDSSNSD